MSRRSWDSRKVCHRFLSCRTGLQTRHVCIYVPHQPGKDHAAFFVASAKAALSKRIRVRFKSSVPPRQDGKSIQVLILFEMMGQVSVSFFSSSESVKMMESGGCVGGGRGGGFFSHSMVGERHSVAGVGTTSSYHQHSIHLFPATTTCSSISGGFNVKC